MVYLACIPHAPDPPGRPSQRTTATGPALAMLPMLALHARSLYVLVPHPAPTKPFQEQQTILRHATSIGGWTPVKASVMVAVIAVAARTQEGSGGSYLVLEGHTSKVRVYVRLVLLVGMLRPPACTPISALSCNTP